MLALRAPLAVKGCLGGCWLVCLKGETVFRLEVVGFACSGFCSISFDLSSSTSIQISNKHRTHAASDSCRQLKAEEQTLKPSAQALKRKPLWFSAVQRLPLHGHPDLEPARRVSAVIPAVDEKIQEKLHQSGLRTPWHTRDVAAHSQGPSGFDWCRFLSGWAFFIFVLLLSIRSHFQCTLHHHLLMT